MSSEIGSSSLAAYWFQFFLDSGIPPADAGSYAVAFTENRIQKSMMNDLSKEYLSDMGITVMGDTIAILKHAKSVYQTYVRDQALKSSGLSKSNQQQLQHSSAGSASKAHQSQQSSAGSAPKAQQLQHQSSAGSTSTKSHSSSKAAAGPAAVKSANQTKAAVSHHESQLKAAHHSSTTAAAANKNKAVATVLSQNSSSTNLVRLSQPQVEEVPVKKHRRVLPEHEGGYKITMPTGSTEKTRKLLSQKPGDNPKSIPTGKSQSVGKSNDKKISNVFSRLGKEIPDKESSSEYTSDSESDSDSDTPQVITDNRSQKIKPNSHTVALSAKNSTVMARVKEPAKKPDVIQSASIFSRLGQKVAAKRTVSWDEEDAMSPSPPKKPFVLVPITAQKEAASKPLAAQKDTIVVRKPVATTRPVARVPEQKSDGLFAGAAVESKPAHERLGSKDGVAVISTKAVGLAGRLGEGLSVKETGGSLSITARLGNSGLSGNRIVSGNVVSSGAKVGVGGDNGKVADGGSSMAARLGVVRGSMGEGDGKTVPGNPRFRVEIPVGNSKNRLDIPAGYSESELRGRRFSTVKTSSGISERVGRTEISGGSGSSAKSSVFSRLGKTVIVD